MVKTLNPGASGVIALTKIICTEERRGLHRGGVSVDIYRRFPQSAEGAIVTGMKWDHLGLLGGDTAQTGKAQCL